MPTRSDRDFSEEIQAHIALETDRLISEGATPEEARLAAIRRFGNVTSARERFYESGRPLWLDQIVADCRLALRSVAKYPLVSIVAILSLACGIGAVTATLTLRNAVFYNPPSLYDSPEGLSFIGVVTSESDQRQGIPTPLYQDLSDSSGLFNGIAAATPPRITDARTSAGEQSVFVRAVSPELFSVVGVLPLLGRTFSGTGDHEAVIGHRTWQLLFQGMPDVVGRNMWIDDQAYTVVGVMPEQFWFITMPTPVWTSLARNPARPDESLAVVVRRAPNVTPATLEEAFQASVDRYVSTLPESERNVRARVESVAGTPLGRSIGLGVVWLLGACVALTVLISCTNVAILMIAHWTAREREIAIRISLGASRGRVVRLLLTESVLTALVGGVLGAFVTFTLLAMFFHQGALDNRPFYDVSINLGVFLRTAAIALLAGVMIGLGPALYETRGLHGNPLRAFRSDRVRQRWRHALVVIEITVTIALLVVTSTMISAYRRNFSMDMGFPTAPLVLAAVDAPDATGNLDLVDRLRTIPEVASVAAGSTVPLMGVGEPQKVATGSASPDMNANRIFIGPEFFATLGVPLVRGREYFRQDRLDLSVVNETLAEKLWPGRDPVGMYLWNEGKPLQVVGVVRNYIGAMLGRPLATFYLPLGARASDPGRLSLIVRSTGDPANLLPAVRREIRATSSFHVPSQVTPMRSIIEQIGEEIITVVYPMSVLIIIGALMTATGIYSVLAFAISRRSKELAVRLAVGATNRQVLRIVAVQCLRLIAAGVVLGVGATFALSRWAQGQGGVFDSPGAAVFVIPVAIIFLVGLLAAWIPSRRAMSLNPAVLLRSD